MRVRKLADTPYEDWMDTFDIVKALTAFRDQSIEAAVYLETISNLEKKCKAYIKATGEVVEVEGVILKFSKGYPVVRVRQADIKRDAKNDESLRKYVYDDTVSPGLRIIVE